MESYRLQDEINVKFAASATTDEDLVAAAKSGDHPAFVELWTRHSKIAFNMVYRITGNQDDAEDVVQDAWMNFRMFRKKSVQCPFSATILRVSITFAGYWNALRSAKAVSSMRSFPASTTPARKKRPWIIPGHSL